MHRLIRAMVAPARGHATEPAAAGPIAFADPLDRVTGMAIRSGAIAVAPAPVGSVDATDPPARSVPDGQRAFRAAVVVAVVVLAAFAIWPVLLGRDGRAATTVTDVSQLVM